MPFGGVLFLHTLSKKVEASSKEGLFVLIFPLIQNIMNKKRYFRFIILSGN